MSDFNIIQLAETQTGNLYSVRFKTTYEEDPFKAPQSTMVKNAQAVAQQYIKILMTTRGMDRFSPDIGAGLARYLKFSNIEDSEIELEISRRVDIAREQFFILQNEEMPSDEERLLDARLMEIFEDDSGDMVISIRIETVSGNVLDIDIPPTNRSLLL